MNTDQIIYETSSPTDISNPLSSITSSLTDTLQPFIWLSLALTVLFGAFYITSFFRRRKLENALFDIQKNLREMNERDKVRSATIVTPPQLRHSSDRIIAATEQPEVAQNTDILG